MKKTLKIMTICLSVCLILSLFATSTFAIPKSVISNSTNQTPENTNLNNSTNSDNTVGDQKPIDVEKIIKLPDGGTDTVYYLGGCKNELFEAPENFNPVNATDEQLKTYGFDPRPKDSEKLKNWSNKYKNYHQHNDKYIPAIMKKKMNPDRDSGNWSGFVVKNSRNINYAQATFAQPSIKSGSYSNAYQSTWVGFGGDNGSTKLIQCGTAMNNAGLLGAKSYKLWYEYLNSSYDSYEVDIANVSPGNHVSVSVTYDGTNAQFFFYISETQLTKTIKISNCQAFYDGTTADFIAERPKINGSIKPLAYFSTINMGGSLSCDGVNNPHNFVTAGNYYDKLTMKNNNGLILAYPGGVVDNSMSAYTNISIIYQHAQ